MSLGLFSQTVWTATPMDPFWWERLTPQVITVGSYAKSIDQHKLFKHCRFVGKFRNYDMQPASQYRGSPLTENVLVAQDWREFSAHPEGAGSGRGNGAPTWTTLVWRELGAAFWPMSFRALLFRCWEWFRRVHKSQNRLLLFLFQREFFPGQGNEEAFSSILLLP